MFPESVLASDPAMEKLARELADRRICRLCLSDVGELLDIDSVGEGCYYTWRMKLASCFGTTNFAGVPRFICATCRSFIEKCFEFKHLCNQSELIFLQYPLTGTLPEEWKIPKWLHSDDSESDPTEKRKSKVDVCYESSSAKKRRVARSQSSSKEEKVNTVPAIPLQSPTITTGNTHLPQVPSPQTAVPMPSPSMTMSNPMLTQQLSSPTIAPSSSNFYQNYHNNQPNTQQRPSPSMTMSNPMLTQQLSSPAIAPSFSIPYQNYHNNQPNTQQRPQLPFATVITRNPAIVSSPYQQVVHQRSVQLDTIISPQYRIHPNNVQYQPQATFMNPMITPINFSYQQPMNQQPQPNFTSPYKWTNPITTTYQQQSVIQQPRLQPTLVPRASPTMSQVPRASLTNSNPNYISFQQLVSTSTMNHPNTITNDQQASINQPPPRENCCNICQTITISKQHLKWHVRRHSTQSIKSYDEYLEQHPRATGCWLCGKVFDTQEQLIDHLERHREVGLRNACDFCMLLFIDNDQWKAHVKAKHAKETTLTMELNK